MFERFTDGARRAVALAQEEARLLHHNWIGTEHLLLGLLHEGEGVAARALVSLGASLEDARDQVDEIIGEVESQPSGHIPFTPRAKKVLELSMREALWMGHNHIGTEHILLGLIAEGEGVAALVLQRLAGDLERVREAVLRLVRGGPQEAPPPVHPSGVSLQATYAAPPMLGRARSCMLCGRDLWEVDRFVRGESGAICDACVTASAQVLERAPEDERELDLPPRAFGVTPEPGAVEAVVHAFEMVFVTQDVAPETRAPFIEDADEVQPFLEAVRARMGHVVVSAVHVGRIRFVGRDRAEVRFTLQLGIGPGGISRDGTAVRREGRWLVSRATIAAMLAPLGVHPPSGFRDRLRDLGVREAYRADTEDLDDPDTRD